MSSPPIFVITHPRACSTAFERVFMTRKDLQCIHEPFGDAFYYGPELLGSRYANDEPSREASGFKQSTYKTVVDRLQTAANEDRRLFIKDMAYYLIAPESRPTSIAPSLRSLQEPTTTSHEKDHSDRSQGAESDAEPRNPTVIPQKILGDYKFAFLIRHPNRSIPSFVRCTKPPLSEVTGWDDFMPSEAGYRELRAFFEYACALKGLDQPGVSSMGEPSTGDHVHEKEMSIESAKDRSPELKEWHENVRKHFCVIDADDLLDDPPRVVEAFCRRVGLTYSPEMLQWDTKEDQDYAEKAFAKWKGWHEDALQSKGLTPRKHARSVKSREDEDAEWAEKFGAEGSKAIRATVDANIEDYEYLRQFAWNPRHDYI